MDWIAYADIITILLSVCLLFKSRIYLYRNARSLILIVIWILYVLPIILDYLVMFNDYTYSSDYKGFALSRKDAFTVLIYDISIIIVQIAILKYPIKYLSNYCKLHPSARMRKTYYVILGIAAVIAPILTILLIRNFQMLYHMQWRELDLFSTSGFYSTIEKLTYFGTVCSVILTFGKYTKKSYLFRFIGIILTYTNICIQGKRAIIFFALICLVLTLAINWISTKRQGKSIRKYILIACSFIPIAVAFMISTSISVKLERGYNPENSDILYTTTRIDFFRDDRVRMSIYSAIDDNMQILDYPFQTLPSEISSFHPFNYITEWLGGSFPPYQTYFTYAMTQTERPPENLMDVKNKSWMTVSFFAELISNFGVILGPVLWVCICLFFIRLVTNSAYPFNIIWLSLFVLINLFDITYLTLFIESFVLCLILKKYEYHI